MDVHARYRTEAHAFVQPRFNERFILSLAKCGTCLAIDDELNLLPLTKTMRDITPLKVPAISGKEDLSKDDGLSDGETIEQLYLSTEQR